MRGFDFFRQVFLDLGTEEGGFEEALIWCCEALVAAGRRLVVVFTGSSDLFSGGGGAWNV